MKYGLDNLADHEADDLCKRLTKAVEVWAVATGLPLPLSPALVHDVTLATTAWVSAWVAGDLHNQMSIVQRGLKKRQ